MSTQVVKTELPSEDISMLSYGELALVLTVLDKEIHMATYFNSLRTDDDHYIRSLVDVQRKMFANIPKANVDGFLENNRHLIHLQNKINADEIKRVRNLETEPLSS